MVAFLAVLASSGVFAEPTTQKVKITSLRSYASDNKGERFMKKLGTNYKLSGSMKIMLSLTLLLIANVSLANAYGSAVRGPDNEGLPVTDVWSTSNGATLFQTTEVHNPNNCSSTWGNYAIPKDKNSKGAMAILLTALTTGRKVKFYVKTDECYQSLQQDHGYTIPVVTRILVTD
jgi:hypothetical protein